MGEGGGVTGQITLSYKISNVTETEQPYSPSGVVGRWLDDDDDDRYHHHDQ